MIYGPKLGIRVAKRKVGGRLSDTVIPMAGFPSSQIDRYLRLFVQQLSKTVVIVDQYQKPTGEEIEGSIETDLDNMKFDRRVSRIVTPGTLIDESFINRESNNFLVALGLPIYASTFNDDSPVGMAWLDLSLGNLYVQSTTLANMSIDLARIQPTELILDKRLERKELETGKQHASFQALEQYYHNYHVYPAKDQVSQYTSLFDETEANVLHNLSELKPHETSALMGLLKYVKNHLPESEIQFQLPEKVNVSQIMRIDSRSRAALELTQAIRDGSSTQGTLLSTVKRTITEPGTRLLTRWIKEPLLDVEEIIKRQNAVQDFYMDPAFQRQLENLLSTLGDSSRVLQKFGLGRGNALDLLLIAQDLDVMSKVRQVVLNYDKSHETTGQLTSLVKKLSPCKNLRDAILLNIDESVLLSKQQQEEREREFLQPDLLHETSTDRTMTTTDKKLAVDEWIIKPAASAPLKRLHDQLAFYQENEVELKESLLKEFPRFKLELKWSQALGFYVHVSGKLAEFDDSAIRSRILTRHKKTLSFREPQWMALGQSMEDVRVKIRSEEKKVINRLKKRVSTTSANEGVL